jgi:hypothetical protein
VVEEGDELIRWWWWWGCEMDAICRVIEPGKLIPDAAFVNSGSRARVIGFAEGAGVIIVSNCDGIFMIELKSWRERKVTNECPPHTALLSSHS